MMWKVGRVLFQPKFVSSQPPKHCKDREVHSNLSLARATTDKLLHLSRISTRKGVRWQPPHHLQQSTRLIASKKCLIVASLLLLRGKKEAKLLFPLQGWKQREEQPSKHFMLQSAKEAKTWKKFEIKRKAWNPGKEATQPQKLRQIKDRCQKHHSCFVGNIFSDEEPSKHCGTTCNSHSCDFQAIRHSLGHANNYLRSDWAEIILSSLSFRQYAVFYYIVGLMTF